MSIPDRLGDFEIVEEIGRGGFGVVYEARQISLDRSVALKVLYQHRVHTDEEIGRFEREAHAAGRIDHPAVVSVFAWGEQDGNFYLAQKLVGRGKTLADRLNELKDSGEPPKGYFRQVAEALAHVAEGLQHAHEKGVIHRDIKPSNILLDEKGQAFLGDFGLAKMEDGLELSRTGEFAGSPYYMSPEQADSKRGALDHRSDIYSLGVALYELLVLEPPFQGRSAHEIIRKILTEEPRLPTKIEPRVPRDLETICLKAMEKGPSRRYQTAEAFARDLHAFLDGEPISAVPASRVSRVWRQVRRHTSSVGMAVMGVVLLGLAYWSYGQLGNIKEQQAEIGVANLERQASQVELAAVETIAHEQAARTQQIDEQIQQALDENDIDRARQLQEQRRDVAAAYDEVKASVRQKLGALTDTENLTGFMSGLTEFIGAGVPEGLPLEADAETVDPQAGAEGLRLASDLKSMFSNIQDMSGAWDLEGFRQTAGIPDREGDPLDVLSDEDDDETAGADAPLPVDAGPPPTSPSGLGGRKDAPAGSGPGNASTTTGPAAAQEGPAGP